MKKLTSFLFFIFTLQLYSQTELPIKFKVTEEANVWIGKEWDLNFKTMKSPINVDFDGKKLAMYYESGKIFLEIDIISYERKERKNYDRLENEVFILKIEKKGFIQYIIINKSYSILDTIITELKIPYVHDTGETMSYNYYISE
jgi:hypothetical protein